MSTQTVTVDASNSGIAQTIVDDALKLAQQACANFVLDHLLSHANDTGGSMPPISAQDILNGANVPEYRDAVITGNLSKNKTGANEKYFDGKRRTSKRLKAQKMLLQCRQVSPRRRK
jgi:hypothetical protein